MAQHILDEFKTAGLKQIYRNIKVGLNIAVALYPYDTENGHVLINYADTAMYHAKNSGKNQ